MGKKEEWDEDCSRRDKNNNVEKDNKGDINQLGFLSNSEERIPIISDTKKDS